MNENCLTDYITGKKIPNVGPEANRQSFEKFLVENKGFSKTDIKIDEEIVVQFQGEDYESTIDIIVFCNEKAIMAIRCVAGSIGSYEREIISGARLVYDYQIPFAISTDGRNASIMDTISGKSFANGLDAIFSKDQAEKMMQNITFESFPDKKKEREMIIYRSFNIEKINK